MILSERFKHASRVSVALLITYGLAIAWAWEKPYWAGMSVLFCAMATAGSSVKACVARVAGTGLSLLAALTLMSLFPQDRWLYLLTMCAMIGVATYLQIGSQRYANVWFNAGFNLPIIALLGVVYGFIGPATFDVAVLRFQQTALGALVFGIVALLLWPGRGELAFLKTVQDVTSSQRELVDLYAKRMAASFDNDRVDELRNRLSGTLTKLRPALYDAAYDKDEINTMCATWECHIDHAITLNTVLERWHEGFDEIKQLELQRYIKGLHDFTKDITACLETINALVVDKAEPGVLQLVEPRLDVEAARELTHFQRAAVMSCHDQLLKIGKLVAAQYGIACAIRKREPMKHEPKVDTGLQVPVLDPDRLAVVFRQMYTLFSAGLVAIFVPSVPNVVFMMTLSNSFAMMSAATPQIPLMTPVKPAMYGLLISGVLYMLLMPRLDSFLQYGIMLFAACFIMTYITYNPVNPLPRIASTVMLVCIITGETPPAYSFNYWVSWVLAVLVWLAISSITWHFPISFKPDVQFKWQLRRLMRSAQALLASLSADPATTHGGWYRWRRRCYLHELTALPARLGRWVRVLPAAALGANGRQAYNTLVSSLQIFGDRLNELLALYDDLLRRYPEEGMTQQFHLLGTLGQQLRSELRDILLQLADDPGGLDVAACEKSLERTEQALEKWVSDIVEKGRSEGSMSTEAVLDLYRWLGAYRGVLEALARVSESAQAVDWTRLREARF